MALQISYFDASDSMITDTVAGLNALADKVAEFLESTKQTLLVVADTNSSSTSEVVLLPSLKLIKGDGPILTAVSKSEGISVTGSVHNLRIWASHFRFPLTARDGDHHHPEYVYKEGYLHPQSASVIIEVLDDSDS